jgi:hypothetical protein
MAQRPGKQRSPGLSLNQFKESIATKRKIENLQKQEESQEAPKANVEPQFLNTGGFVAKQRPAKIVETPEEIQKRLDNHSEILKKHGPRIQAHLKFLDKTRGK